MKGKLARQFKLMFLQCAADIIRQVNPYRNVDELLHPIGVRLRLIHSAEEQLTLQDDEDGAPGVITRSIITKAVRLSQGTATNAAEWGILPLLAARDKRIVRTSGVEMAEILNVVIRYKTVVQLVKQENKVDFLSLIGESSGTTAGKPRSVGTAESGIRYSYNVILLKQYRK